MMWLYLLWLYQLRGWSELRFVALMKEKVVVWEKVAFVAHFCFCR